MNWKKLFEIQAGLDQHIIEEKGLQGQDLLDKKILALQVELGELANEWRGFKFWKVNPQPNIDKIVDCSTCVGTGDENSEANLESLMEEKGSVPYKRCEECDGTGISHHVNPMLIEYVDCLHFILSIGLELGVHHSEVVVEDDLAGATTTETFNDLFSYITTLYSFLDVNLPATIKNEDIRYAYQEIVECFVSLGEKNLGFTWEQIVTAYMAKNKVNHERQNTGY